MDNEETPILERNKKSETVIFLFFKNTWAKIKNNPVKSISILVICGILVYFLSLGISILIVITDKTSLEFKVNRIHVTNVCEEIGPRLLIDIDFYNPTLLNAVIGDIAIKLYFKNSSDYDLIETNSVDLIINSRERVPIKSELTLKFNESSFAEYFKYNKIQNIAEGTSLRFFATVRTNSFIIPLVASIDRSIALNDLFGENHETEAENKNWPFSIKSIKYLDIDPKESAGFMVELAKSGYEAFIIDFPDTNFQINLFNSEQRILDVLVHSGTFKTDDEPMKVEFSTSRKYEFRITEFVKMLQNKEDIPLVFSFKNNQKCQILNLLDDAQLKLEISTESDVLNDKKPDSIKSVRHLKEMNDEYSLNGVEIELVDLQQTERNLFEWLWNIKLYNRMISFIVEQDEPNFEFLTGFPLISIETQLQKVDIIEDKLLSFELLNLTIESRAEKDFLNVDVKIQTSNLPDTLKGFSELISRSEEYEYYLRMSSGSENSFLSDIISLFKFNISMYENDLVATNVFQYDDSLNPLLYSISSKIKSEKYTVYSNFNASLPTDTLGGPHIKVKWPSLSVLVETDHKLSQKVRVLNMGLDESFLHFNLGLFQLSSDFVTSLHGGQVIWHADIVNDNNRSFKKLIRRDSAIADLLFSFFRGESFDSVKMSFFIHSNLRQRYEGEWPGFLLKDSRKLKKVGGEAIVEVDSSFPFKGLEFLGFNESSCYIAFLLPERLNFIDKLTNNIFRPVRVDLQLSISDVDLYLKRNDEFRGETTSMLKISMDELYISAALDCKQNSVFKYVTIKQNKWDNVKNIQGIRVNATILDSKSFFLLLQDYLYFDKRNEYKEDFESEIKDRLKNMKNREKDEIVAVIKLYLNLDNELNMLSRIIAMMIYSKPVFQYGTYYELNNAKVNNLKIYEASALLAEPTPDSAKKHIDESKLKLEIKSPDLKSMDIVFTFSLPKSETVEDIKNIPSGVFIIKWGKIDVSLMYQSSLIFRFQLEQNSLPIRLGNSPHSGSLSTPDIELTVSTYSEHGVSRDFLDFFQRIFGYWENKEKQLPSFHFEGFIYNYNDGASQHNSIKAFIKSNGIDGDDIRNLISSRQQIKVDEYFNFFSFLDWVPNFKAIIKDKNFPCFIPYFCDFFKIQSFSEPFQVSIVIDLESELTSFFQNISSEIFSILDIFSFNMNITQLRFEFSSDPIFFDIFVNGFSMIMIDAKQFIFSITSNRKPTDNFKKSAQIVEPINITIKTTNQYADAYNVLKSLEMFQVFAPTSIASPSVKNLNIKTIPFDNFTLSYGQSDVARTNLLSNILSNVINEMQVENYAFNLQDYINVKVIKTEKSFLTLQFILDKYLDSNLNKFLSDGFKINLYEKENILFNVYYHNSDLFLMLYNDKMQVTRVINAIVGGQGSNLDLLFVNGKEEILKISFRIPVFIQNYQEDLIIRDSKHIEPSFFNVAFDFSDFFSLFKLSVPLKMDIYNPTLLEVSLASLHLSVSLYDPKSVTSRKIAVYRKLTKQCNVNPYPECLYTNSSSSSLLQLKPMTVNSITVPLKLIKLGETFSSIIKNGLNHCINIAVQLFLVVSNGNQEPFLFPINITMNKISTTEKAIRKDVCRTIMNCIPRSRLADTISPLSKQNSFRIYDNSQSPTENDIYWYPATIHSSESFILSLSFSHRSSQTNLKVFQLQAQANIKESSHDSFAFHVSSSEYYLIFRGKTLLKNQYPLRNAEVRIYYNSFQSLMSIKVIDKAGSKILQSQLSISLSKLGDSNLYFGLLAEEKKNKLKIESWKIEKIIPSFQNSRLVRADNDRSNLYFFEAIDSCGNILNIDDSTKPLNFRIETIPDLRFFDYKKSNKEGAITNIACDISEAIGLRSSSTQLRRLEIDLPNPGRYRIIACIFDDCHEIASIYKPIKEADDLPEK